MNLDLFIQDTSGSIVEFFGAPSGQRIRIRQGSFMVAKLNDGPAAPKWASTHDSVLKITGDSDGAVEVALDAMNAGKSELQVQTPERNVELWLDVEVFNTGEAVKGTFTVGDPEPK